MERAKATLQGQSQIFLALGLADAYVRQKYSDKEGPDAGTGRPSRLKMSPTSGFETKKPIDLVGAARLNKAKLFSGSRTPTLGFPTSVFLMCAFSERRMDSPTRESDARFSHPPPLKA